MEGRMGGQKRKTIPEAISSCHDVSVCAPFNGYTFQEGGRGRQKDWQEDSQGRTTEEGENVR